MKEIDEVYEQDKKLCVAKFQTLKYFHPAIPTVLTDTSCFEPYRVCRRLNILRDYSDEKPNYTPKLEKERFNY